MSILMSKLMQKYSSLMALGDPRATNLPLMSTPWPTLLMSLLYVLFCVLNKSPGKREAFLSSTKIKFFLVIHNVLTLLLNLHIVLELMDTAGFSLSCVPVDYSDNANNRRIVRALWLFYLSKLYEFVDTLFLVLNAKRISFLHCYHHATMFCLWWIGVRFVAGGSAAHAAMLNSCVHVLMYTYYLLSALKFRMNSLKPFLTILQMLQFVAALVSGLHSLTMEKCGFPTWMQYALVLYMISLLALFANFFRQAYCKVKLA